MVKYVTMECVRLLSVLGPKKQALIWELTQKSGRRNRYILAAELVNGMLLSRQVQEMCNPRGAGLSGQ